MDKTLKSDDPDLSRVSISSQIKEKIDSAGVRSITKCTTIADDEDGKLTIWLTKKFAPRKSGEAR